jgi:hypothetical protein
VTDESILLNLMECTIEPKSAVYCAVPVTSGIRLWRLAKGLGVSDTDHVKALVASRYSLEVLKPNFESALAFVHAARERHGVVINPSKLVVPSWSQSQYAGFWESVIGRFAHSVVLSPDWIYSRGCVYECIYAIRSETRLLDAKWNPVSITDLRTIAEAARELRNSWRLRADFIDEFTRSLEEVTRE